MSVRCCRKANVGLSSPRMFTHDISSVYIYDLSTEHLFHTPSIAFRNLPPWRKNVVNQCLEFATVYDISYVLGMLVHH